MKNDLSLRRAAMAPAVRRDLARYAKHAPVDYDVDRGLERLTASLAVAAAAGSGSASAATGLKALAAKAIALPALQTLPALKVLAVCLVVGTAGTVAAVHASREEPPPVVAAAVTPARSPVPKEPPLHVAPPAPAEPATPPPAAPAPVVEHSEHRGPARVAPSLRAERRPERKDDARDLLLREEMSALVHLRELASRDPAAAVALAAEDDARYGRDDLYGEEREAIALVALAHSGRPDEARVRGRAFLALHPKSPFATLVRGVLAPQ
jgi:hypothetical protein